MKKSIKLLLSVELLMLAACSSSTSSSISAPVSSNSSISSISSVATSNPSSTSSSVSSITSGSSTSSVSESSISSASSQSSISSITSQESSETSVSSSESTSEESSSNVEEPLAMTLNCPLTQDENGVYLIKVYNEVQLTPTYNHDDYQEQVTYTTKEGMWGSASTNISISETGLLKALNKSDVITITITGSDSGLSVSFKLKVYNELDNYKTELTSKLATSLTKETNTSNGGTFEYSRYDNSVLSKKTSATFKAFANQSIESEETNKDNESSYIYSGIYQNKYYNVKKDAEGNYTSVKKLESDSNNASSLYQVNITSMNSYYGISKYVNYLLTDTSSYFSSTSAANNATITKETNSYTLSSNYKESVWGTNKYYALSLVLNFNNDDSLSSFSFSKETYDNTGYDFDNNSFIESGTSIAKETASATLTYAPREASSSKFSPSELFVTDYTVKISDKSTGTIGTSFEVDTVLSFDYDTYLPATAYPTIDKLSFVSSSNTNVINTNENNELVCLAEGQSTLKFTSSNGVEKEVTITVTYSGVKEIKFNDEFNSLDKIYIGDTISNISARIIPTLLTQPYEIYIAEGSDNATLVKESDNTYTLTGVKAGTITIKAKTIYNDQTFECSKTLTIATQLTNEQIINILVSKSFTYSSTNWAGNTTYTITFEQTSGKFTNGSYELTFDYVIENKNVVISNTATTNASYVLDSVSINEDVTEITVVIINSSSFGTYSYTYKLA